MPRPCDTDDQSTIGSLGPIILWKALRSDPLWSFQVFGVIHKSVLQIFGLVATDAYNHVQTKSPTDGALGISKVCIRIKEFDEDDKALRLGCSTLTRSDNSCISQL